MPPQIEPQLETSKQNSKKIWLLVIFGFVLIAVNLYFFCQMYFPKSAPENQNLTAETTTDEFADWKTYRNEEYGFEFSYPSNWSTESYGQGIISLSIDPGLTTDLSATCGELGICISEMRSMIKGLNNKNTSNLIDLVDGRGTLTIHGSVEESFPSIPRYKFFTGFNDVYVYITLSDGQNECEWGKSCPILNGQAKNEEYANYEQFKSVISTTFKFTK